MEKKATERKKIKLKTIEIRGKQSEFSRWMCNAQLRKTPWHSGQEVRLSREHEVIYC